MCPVLRRRGWRLDWLRQPRDVAEWTYCLCTSDYRAVKVGRTAGAPEHRLRTLQTGSAQTLLMVGMTAHISERRLHRRLKTAGTHLHHEWFAVSDHLLTELASFDYLDVAAYATLRARLLSVAPAVGRDAPCCRAVR
jgi:hypothetical protein